MSVYAGPIINESVSAVTSTPSVELGTVVVRNGLHYIYVYNNGTSDISVGNGAIVSGLSGFSVTVSSTTSVDILFGVCKHATIATTKYGWLLRKGPAVFATGANESFAAGNLLVLAGDGKFANKTISTGFLAPAQGKAISAAVSGTVTASAYFSIF